MTTGQGPLTAQHLRGVNDLTRRSPAPGNLDYLTYRRYLADIGHVKRNQTKITVGATSTVQNTQLQHQRGSRSDNLTDFRADQAFWSQDYLPDIIYSFDKPNYWLEKNELNEAPLKTYQTNGERLRDLPILPDHVSSNVEGWRVEAWTRFDPRVGLQDIMARIPDTHRPDNKSVIQMRALRFREQCNVLGWVVPGRNFETRKQAIITKLTNAGINIHLNSTRGLSWGLVNPSQGEGAGRVAIPQNRRVAGTVEDVVAGQLHSLPSSLTVPPSAPSSSSSASLLPPLSQPSALAPAPFSASTTPAGSQSNRRWQQQQHQHRRQDHVNSHSASVSSISASTSPTSTSLPSKPHSRPILSSHPSSLTSCAATPVIVATPQIVPLRAPTPKPSVGLVYTTTYHGRALVLKNERDRRTMTQEDLDLLARFHAAGTEERRRQLAFLLDPARVSLGWLDNRGFNPPLGYQGCVEADIIYRSG